MPAGEDETVATGPVGVARVVPHHPLEQRVRQRRQAHRGAGVAVADLLDRVGGQHADGVDGAAVEVGPVVGHAHRGPRLDVDVGHSTPSGSGGAGGNAVSVVRPACRVVIARANVHAGSTHTATRTHARR